MSSNEFEKPPEGTQHDRTGNSHTGLIAGLTVGLMVALCGDAYLLVRTNHANEEMARLRDGTQTQISKLGEATTSLLEQRMQELDEQLKGSQDSAAVALKRARAEAQKQEKGLRSTLEEQEKQFADQMTQLKDSSDSKITEVSTDVNSVKTDVSGVKTDVSGVKTDVSGVKADVASTQSELEKTAAELKRAMGDMGVMSGLIATNGKDLAALRELGERNYFEFDLAKNQKEKKVGNITLALKRSDPKHNRYTIEIVADDKRVEKQDRTINEPVQLYVSSNRQPYEVVVNQIKKDEIVGYLATPKVTVARQ